MKINVYIIIILFLSISKTVSQSINWQNTFGGNGNDWMSFVEKTKDGNYIVGGYHSSTISGDVTQATRGASDYWLLKIDDSSGNIIWQKSIGGDYLDHLTSAKETADGGYILGGYTRSTKSGDISENLIGIVDFWVLKLDSDRNIIWQERYGGTGVDRLNSIIETSDGGFIMGGESNSNISGNKTENSRGENDYWVIKIDENGNIQWQRTYGGSDKDFLESILISKDGGYLLTGSSHSDISGEKMENSRGVGGDYWIIKIDNLGNIEWQRTIGGDNGDYARCAIKTSDGNYIISGDSSSNISGEKTSNSICNSLDLWIVKLSAEGNIIWQKTLGGDSTEWEAKVFETFNKGIIVGGMSYSGISGYKTEESNGDRDYWAVKLDYYGNVIWDKSYGGSSTDEPAAIIQANDGNYVIGGWSSSNISGDKTENSNGSTDFWLIKFQMNINNYTEENAELVTYCIGGDLQLIAPGGAISYNWTGPNNFNSSDQNPVIPNASILNEGIYNLEISSTDSCLTEYKLYQAISSISLNAGENTSITVNRSDTPFNLFDKIEGNPDAGGIWNPGLVSGTDIFDPATDIGREYTYTVGDVDCKDEALVNVIILEEVSDLDYLRFFSPNGDSMNDTWGLQGIDDKDYKLYIFNRFGKVLKELTPTNSVWDGYYNGTLQAPDDYWFKVIFEDGTTKSGHFALLK